jgi:hypothetical protein
LHFAAQEQVYPLQSSARTTGNEKQKRTRNRKTTFVSPPATTQDEFTRRKSFTEGNKKLKKIIEEENDEETDTEDDYEPLVTKSRSRSTKVLETQTSVIEKPENSLPATGPTRPVQRLKHAPRSTTRPSLYRRKPIADESEELLFRMMMRK